MKNQQDLWSFIVFKSKPIEFKLWGRYALFTDPATKTGGEKFSYHIPTYEALKGIAKSIYWKPTFIWVIDEVRVINQISTQTKGTKPLNFHGKYPSERDQAKKEAPFNTLAIYTFLHNVEYQVKAHFVWNTHRPELADDRIAPKHQQIAERMLKRGGRQDIFLGTRDCQGYVEPCEFGSGESAFDNNGELAYGLMFHGFDYPDETGENKLITRFWNPIMKNGVIKFLRPENCTIKKFVREMEAKSFKPKENFSGLKEEGLEL